MGTARRGSSQAYAAAAAVALLWGLPRADAKQAPPASPPALARQPEATAKSDAAAPASAARATEAPAPVPELMIAGHTVMRLRASAGGLTPQERAYDLRQRLGPILTLPDLSAADVTVRQERPGQTASIYVRERLLITVDRNLAKANNTSIQGLAGQWARNLQATLPQVNVAVRLSGNTAWANAAPGARGRREPL